MLRVAAPARSFLARNGDGSDVVACQLVVRGMTAIAIRKIFRTPTTAKVLLVSDLLDWNSVHDFRVVLVDR